MNENLGNLGKLMAGIPRSVGGNALSRRQFLWRAAGAGMGSAGAGFMAGFVVDGDEKSLDSTGVTGTTTVGEGDGTLPPVKIGYIPITDATPLLVAHANGYFADEGLEAERPTLIRGWSSLAESFQAHNFNLTHLLFPIPVYLRYARGFPVKVVAWYSMHNIILQMALRATGLEPVIQDQKAALTKKQTNLFVMAPPDMPTALSTGAIDGYIVAEPFNAAGELLAGARIIRFTGDIWQNHPCCVAVMHEDDLRARREWSQKVVNALTRAERWSRENKEEAAHILSREGEGYLPLPEKVIRRSMTKYDQATYGMGRGTGAIRHPEWDASRIAFQPYQFRSATKRMVKEMKVTRMEGDSSFLAGLSPEHVADDLLDYELVKVALEKVGGLAEFDGAYNDFEREEVIEV